MVDGYLALNGFKQRHPQYKTTQPEPFPRNDDRLEIPDSGQVAMWRIRPSPPPGSPFTWPDVQSQRAASFVTALLAAAKAKGPAQFAATEAVLRTREFPLPR